MTSFKNYITSNSNDHLDFCSDAEGRRFTSGVSIYFRQRGNRRIRIAFATLPILIRHCVRWLVLPSTVNEPSLLVDPNGYPGEVRMEITGKKSYDLVATKKKLSGDATTNSATKITIVDLQSFMAGMLGMQVMIEDLMERRQCRREQFDTYDDDNKMDDGKIHHDDDVGSSTVSLTISSSSSSSGSAAVAARRDEELEFPPCLPFSLFPTTDDDDDDDDNSFESHAVGWNSDEEDG